jgi:hypothetical protein
VRIISVGRRLYRAFIRDFTVDPQYRNIDTGITGHGPGCYWLAPTDHISLH